MSSPRMVPKLGWIDGHGVKTSFELSTVYEFLAVIRQEPGLFSGEPSLTALGGFLEGFRAALTSMGTSFDDEEPPFLAFHDWIAARFGFSEATPGWKNMLLQSLGDESAALERFLTEVDEFRRTKGS